MMQFICCPRCKAELILEQSSYLCKTCLTEYPIIMGIPDFRVDVELSHRKREAIAIEELMVRYNATESFSDFLTKHVRDKTDPDLVDHEIRYELSWKSRAKEAQYRIDKLLNKTNWCSKKCDLYLDIGCGKGAMVASLFQNFKNVIGVDYTLRYLVFAKKLIEEIGADNVLLVCASAERLPFKDHTFDMVSALDVIEHIDDQEGGLRELCRVISESGILYMNSPNRYSIFTREDHVLLWGVGFLPRKFMDKYVRYFRGQEYQGVKLLSYWDIISMMNCLKGQYFVEGLMFDSSSSDNLIIKRILSKHPFVMAFINKCFKFVIPSYNLIYQKEG